MNKIFLERLYRGDILNKPELMQLIQLTDTEEIALLCSMANQKKEEVYGNSVFIRGLIEFSNYCKNDCYYCGIRCSNQNAERYRMNLSEILESCDIGNQLGFQTFVLQGGEDPYFTDEKICEIVSTIKQKYPKVAITLSLGEKNYASYQEYKKAGADRYLLRHETANEEHYQKLHPKNMSCLNRKQCLRDLKEIGFQTGAGCMVGSPYQTDENLAEDLLFLKELEPHMVGIGPFIHHAQTPFSTYPDGTVEKTVIMIALTRLLLPHALIPSTTALASLAQNGRHKALLSGANVVMPNLTPISVRRKYLLYQNKICLGEETGESFGKLKQEIEELGLVVDLSRGDFCNFSYKK